MVNTIIQIIIKLSKYKYLCHSCRKRTICHYRNVAGITHVTCASDKHENGI